MCSEVLKANSTFYRFIKTILGKFLINRYHVSCEIDNIKGLKPPYIILANHVNNLDPFLISHFVDYPVHFVASDEQYRNLIKRYFLKHYLGAIPKTKFVSDIKTVKQIIKLVKENCVIGIFPEGRRNWDGNTGIILPSTSKLIKLLKVPIVICIMKGAHLSHPRWAIKDRRGKINISFTSVLTAESISNMSVNEIQNELTRLLYHNEYDFQRKMLIPYKGVKLAEKLERLLFICPKCYSISSMNSCQNTFYCTKCGYIVTYTEYGYFNTSTDKIIFHEPYIWNMWQLKYLKNFLEQACYKDEEILIYKDEKVRLYSADRFSPLKKIAEGQLILNNKGFYFIGSDEYNIEFRHNLITGLNIQYSNELEFYYENQLYRFKFCDIGTSAYKWTVALEYQQYLRKADILWKQHGYL